MSLHKFRNNFEIWYPNLGKILLRLFVIKTQGSCTNMIYNIYICWISRKFGIKEPKDEIWVETVFLSLLASYAITFWVILTKRKLAVRDIYKSTKFLAIKCAFWGRGMKQDFRDNHYANHAHHNKLQLLGDLLRKK